MVRDYHKLLVYTLAQELAIKVYDSTKAFPESERFGLVAQMRRAAVSIGSNIVEGSARNTQLEYVNFLNIAYGSACELSFQIELAGRLGFFDAVSFAETTERCSSCAKALNGLINALKKSPGSASRA